MKWDRCIHNTRAEQYMHIIMTTMMYTLLYCNMCNTSLHTSCGSAGSRRIAAGSSRYAHHYYQTRFHSPDHCDDHHNTAEASCTAGNSTTHPFGYLVSSAEYHVIKHQVPKSFFLKLAGQLVRPFKKNLFEWLSSIGSFVLLTFQQGLGCNYISLKGCKYQREQFALFDTSCWLAACPFGLNVSANKLT